MIACCLTVCCVGIMSFSFTDILVVLVMMRILVGYIDSFLHN